MPFVTEELYSSLPIKNKELLIFESYPTINKKLIFKDETKKIDELLEFVTLFRNKKLENNRAFLEGVVSRKKQLLPQIDKNI